MSKEEKTDWRFIAWMSVLMIAVGIAGYHLFSVMHEATQGAFIKPGMGDYKVLQSHNGGREMEVEYNGKAYTIDYVATHTNDPDVNLDAYPYEPGEVLRMQVMCTGSIPAFYKEFDDADGEREYKLAALWGTNNKDFCKTED